MSLPLYGDGTAMENVMYITTIIDKGDFGREICRYVTDTESRAHEIGYAAAEKLDAERCKWHGYEVSHAEYVK